MAKIINPNKVSNMSKRTEQIEQAAKEAYGYPLSQEFIEGAEWADKNPMSKYNLSKTDLVVSQLQTIVNNAERMTTGNMAHNRASILLMARMVLKNFNEINNE